MPNATPILLEFDPSLSLSSEKHPVRANLSVAVRTGRDLWLASDEGAMLERLTEVGEHHFARHTRFALTELLDLPDEDESEVDIEGISFDGRYLWVVGSHGLKRKKPKAKLSEEERIERLAMVSRDANRYLLARIPCVEGKDGAFELRREAEGSRRLPLGEPQRLVAAQLEAKGDGNALTAALEDDEHLAPFLQIPGKDNGFDIEGLAVADGRLYVGLRGPVLRGYAVILSMELEEDEDDPATLRLVDRKVGREADGDRITRGFAKHFLDLQGMGIRELSHDGRDLLILAGPTMALDGTIALFRWHAGASAARDQMVDAEELSRLFDIPHGPGTDRAEGMTLWSNGSGKRLLVVYDGPAERRLAGSAGVYADLFPLS